MKRTCMLAVWTAIFLATASAQTDDTGRRAFQAHCVGCHGDDGTGGGHGPDIVNIAQPHAPSQSAVTNLILQRIPDAGIPAFQLTAKETDAIAASVMLLKAPTV